MVSLNRRITILIHIKRYCNEILETFNFLGTDFDTFRENNIFRDAISMKMFQIGELVKELDRVDKDYITKTKDKVPWKDIIRMRERFAHHYGEMKIDIIYSTAIEDISKLNLFIENELEK